MFTGLVEEVGRVKVLSRGRDSARIQITAHTILADAKIGDSIAVNGVCLTVTERGADYFSADVMTTTLSKSNLGQLTVGALVNLERALAADGRFGGHIVSGHIDGVARIIKKTTADIALLVTLASPPELLPYILKQGSVALDGISLTVADKGVDCFSVSLIPHTTFETALASKKIGDTVNLETDVVGKYVASLFKGAQKNGLSQSFLVQHGFI